MKYYLIKCDLCHRWQGKGIISPTIEKYKFTCTFCGRTEKAVKLSLKGPYEKATKELVQECAKLNLPT